MVTFAVTVVRMVFWNPSPDRSERYRSLISWPTRVVAVVDVRFSRSRTRV
jgi:hypothetical protein